MNFYFYPMENKELKTLVETLGSLKNQIEDFEVNQNLKKNSLVKIVEDWKSILLAGIAVFAALWGFVIPIKNYFDEKNSALRYELNQNMISLMDSLSSTDLEAVDASVLLLSYYEENSLPMLFYKLERTKKKSNESLVNSIVQIIVNIYEKNGSEVLEIIDDRLESQSRLFSKSAVKDDFNLYALSNILDLIKSLPLDDCDKRKLREIVQRTKTELGHDQKTLSKHVLLNESLNSCLAVLESNS